MTEHERLQPICRWNRELARENRRLRDELRRLEGELVKLTDTNANLRVEREAADVVLGRAMDRLLELERS